MYPLFKFFIFNILDLLLSQKFIIYPYIGPVAQAENKDLSEKEKSSLEEIALINKRWGLIIIASESVSRMKTSSAKLG